MRGRSTRRFRGWTEVHPFRRRIARPGSRWIAQNLLRTSLQRQPQALRDDHEPEGPRHQTPHRHSKLHGAEPRCPGNPVTEPRTRPVTPRLSGRRTEIRQPTGLAPRAPLRCRHRRGMRPRQPRRRKPRPGVAITRAVPGGVRSRPPMAEATKDVPRRPPDGVPNSVRGRSSTAETAKDVPRRPSDGVPNSVRGRSSTAETAKDVPRRPSDGVPDSV